MLGSAIIVFREVLEAALIISIVLAATRGVVARGWWISGGVAAGLSGSILVAFSAELISGAMEGTGQEIFNAGILLTAVLMLGWHNIWMAQHGKELAVRMSAIGNNVSAGQEPMYALAVAVMLAVLREGSEIVLFLNGIMASGETPLSLLTGSMLGLAVGGLAGYMLYSGLIRVPVSQFFRITSWMILLLASGMAAGAAGFLEQAGWLPAIKYGVWDTSNILSQKSVIGQILHTLVGYHDRPSGIQVVFYVVTLVVIFTLMQLVDKRQNKGVRVAGPAAA